MTSIKFYFDHYFIMLKIDECNILAGIYLCTQCERYRGMKHLSISSTGTSCNAVRFLLNLAHWCMAKLKNTVLVFLLHFHMNDSALLVFLGHDHINFGLCWVIEIDCVATSLSKFNQYSLPQVIHLNYPPIIVEHDTDWEFLCSRYWSKCLETVCEL
jgi:hypothetical protein